MDLGISKDSGISRKRKSMTEFDLRAWKDQWLKLFPSSHVFLDVDPNSTQDYTKYTLRLKSLGCNIVTKFNLQVTIIVSDRSYNSAIPYPSWDPFTHLCSHPHIKVWSAAKCERFLHHFRRLSNPYVPPEHQAERGFQYFDKSKYMAMVYDLQQRQRPVGVKEYAKRSQPLFCSSPSATFVGGYICMAKNPITPEKQAAIVEASSVERYRDENATNGRMGLYMSHETYGPGVPLHRTWRRSSEEARRLKRLSELSVHPSVSEKLRTLKLKEKDLEKSPIMTPVKRQNKGPNTQLLTPRDSPIKPLVQDCTNPPSTVYCEPCRTFIDHYEEHKVSAKHRMAISSPESREVYRDIDLLISRIGQVSGLSRSVSYWT
ncbi:hypothetical protein BABINDRAFT_163557 [Babjeviella inositovora NRRL Y-12698]|uniref:DBF4-type domain-containing protein n=1 Tax=Babjeviella inositovora NRRL Y-12698 TaxID=984486 RepID=A0A1E3QJU8_9ASCO|nr:uncharacterized protein BABINDRAFT_163557 [Babjeviella inositovora NRRL Y-12698]ODQ77277.1 hypothetical protein BABINDRAFT_163557 [Babjeviella inositovora NRRL Y-12698]